jgi:hypothetical protein
LILKFKLVHGVLHSISCAGPTSYTTLYFKVVLYLSIWIAISCTNLPTVLWYSCMMPLHVEKYLTNWAHWNKKSIQKQIKNKYKIKHWNNWPTVLPYSCMMPLHVEKYLTNWAYSNQKQIKNKSNLIQKNTKPNIQTIGRQCYRIHAWCHFM